MTRTADYTIQGFMYQFNKTILEILNAEDIATINIEGVVEDIEVVTSTTMKGVQCKYHETSKGFTCSAIFKPLLQMMEHFSAHPVGNIKYVLFAHFPGAEAESPPVGRAECVKALSSKDKSFKKHIDAISPTIDIDKFLKRFTMEFGLCYAGLVAQVIEALETNGIPFGEIETLAYPNAINIVANISIRHKPDKRKITKKKFLEELKQIRNTAISRWTMALKTKDKLLKARRKQLKTHLDKNHRQRYLIIDPNSLCDYEAEIILFLKDYIEKYHFKFAHISTPVICFCATPASVQEIQHRLYTNKILTTNGYIGTQFEEAHFFRKPLSEKGAGGIVQREFSLRVIDWVEHSSVLNNKKCDDLFILGELDYSTIDTIDLNVECLSGVSFKEIKYVMGICDVYD